MSATDIDETPPRLEFTSVGESKAPKSQRRTARGSKFNPELKLPSFKRPSRSPKAESPVDVATEAVEEMQTVSVAVATPAVETGPLAPEQPVRKRSRLNPELKMPSLKSRELKMPSLKNSELRMPTLGRGRCASSTTVLTGLELGATQAVAARAEVVDGRIVAQRVAARTLPEGLLREGLVVDPAGLASELRDLFAEHRLDKRVRVGLATPRTILRVIDLPPLDESDVRTALAMHAQERIPMPLETAVLDHQTIGLVETPDGQRLRVIVVVSEREGVERLLEALHKAGLKPEGIDLSVFAAIRAVSSAPPPVGPVLYAQLGDLVNIAIAESGICHFTRQAPQGLTLVLERLAALYRDSTPADARQLLATLTDGDAPMPAAGEIGGMLAQTASELGAELRAATEFYASQFGSSPVTEGVITGVLAPLPGFVPALADASGLDLRCGEIAVAEQATLGGIDGRVAPVAVGLAVGEVTA